MSDLFGNGKSSGGGPAELAMQANPLFVANKAATDAQKKRDDAFDANASAVAAKQAELRQKPLSEWTDEELAKYGDFPEIGAGDLHMAYVKEVEGRQRRKDYLSTSLDQPGRRQTVTSFRSPSLLGKPIL